MAKVEPPDPSENHFTHERPELAGDVGFTIPGLDDIDWAGHSDAYGSAAHTPVFLRALTSNDASDRDWAYDALWASINHQGTPSEVSPHVVPFLLALLDWDALPERDRLLRFLAEMSVGDSRWAVECGTEVDAFPQSDCAPAVAVGARQIAHGRTDARAVVRAASYFACALIPACDAFVPPPLSDEVRGVLLGARIAAALRARRLGEALPHVRQWVESADHWESLVGRVALGYAAPETLDAADIEAAERLGATLPDPWTPRPDDWPEGLEWDLGTALTAQALTASIPHDLEGKVDRVAAAGADHDPVAIECARRAMDTLAARAPAEVVPFERFDPLLQRLLRALASPKVFAATSYAQAELSCLPRGHAAFSRLVGIGAAGALDDRVDGEPLWLKLHQALLDGAVDPLRALPQTRRLACIADALRHPRWFSDMQGAHEFPATNRVQARLMILLAENVATLPALEQGANPTLLLEPLREAAARKGELFVSLVHAAVCKHRGTTLSAAHTPSLDVAPVAVFPSAVAYIVRELADPDRDTFVRALPLVQASRRSLERRSAETNAVVERRETTSLYFPTVWWEVLAELPGAAARERVRAAVVQAASIRRERAAFDPLLPPHDNPFPMTLARQVLPNAVELLEA